ncbi:MAG: hypothetical protein CK540_03130 [Thermoleophilia bacterium]|nr:MAG: hypothetical protein CK540_03130 [Thermoleophilia bacterium]
MIAVVQLALIPAGAAAQGSATPTQAQNDGATVGSTTGAGWGSLAGGVAARPFVSRLTATNAGVETVLIDGGSTTPPAVTAGIPTVVISPLNLCQAGQTPAQGVCHATPNRISLALGVPATDNVNTDLTGSATTEMIFDMTVRMNTLGQSLRWSWANLDLLYWSATGLGTADAQIRIRFRPVATQFVSDFTGGQGCTATPIGACDIQRAALQVLSANIVFSLDETVNLALTGAIFATQGAIFGFLNPTGTASAPVLDLQMAAAHFRADGSIQTGQMKAVLPAQTLLNIYGVLPADAATFFSATRSGSAGTNGAPTYKVKRKTVAAKTTVKTSGAKTTVSVKALAACRKALCTATVYTTGTAVSGKSKKIATIVSAADGSMSLSFPKAKLKKGAPYSVTIRLKKGSKLVTTAAGLNGSAFAWGTSSGGNGGNGSNSGNGGSGGSGGNGGNGDQRLARR